MRSDLVTDGSVEITTGSKVDRADRLGILGEEYAFFIGGSMEIKSIEELVAGNPYPGRGIVVGESTDGKSAVLAYFIMGRSANSRNRVLAVEEGALYTRPFDESKVADPSLIIYPAMRKCGGSVILTNGDQTDTIYAGLQTGKDFFDSLETREYEPDAPNYTPRISAFVTPSDKGFSYKLSILRRTPSGECERARFSYAAQAGVGHFLHTYRTDGAPLPSFEGAPKEVSLPAEIDDFAQTLWSALDEENKISLYVAYIDLATGEETSRLYNKNQRRDQ